MATLDTSTVPATYVVKVVRPEAPKTPPPLATMGVACPPTVMEVLCVILADCATEEGLVRDTCKEFPMLLVMFLAAFDFMVRKTFMCAWDMTCVLAVAVVVPPVCAEVLARFFGTPGVVVVMDMEVCCACVCCCCCCSLTLAF